MPINRSVQFKKDYKRCLSQERDIKQLLSAIETLATIEELSPDMLDRSLSAGRIKTVECHLDSDWVLLYRIEKRELFLIRTGSHAEVYCV